MNRLPARGPSVGFDIRTRLCSAPGEGGFMKVNRRIGTAGIGAVLVTAALVVPQWDAGAATAQTWQLTPPGGTGPAATVSLDGTGGLEYGGGSVAYRQGEPSAL